MCRLTSDSSAPRHTGSTHSPALMAGLLLDDIQYKIEETRFGTRKRYLNPTAARFKEFRSHVAFFGLLLLHFTLGVCPEAGRRRVARGVIAIGRFAVGILALG